MSVSVAVSNSPGFSPSASMFCNKSSIISPAPEGLTLSLSHLKPSQSSSSSSPSSPSSPFRLRLQKPPSGFSPSGFTSSSSSSASTILKRKRPARLDIPMASLNFAPPGTLSGSREVMEVESDGYSVCCKRGRRRIAMEDRYAAVVDLQGDHNQAFFGVFDGHGGAKAAQFAAENLEKNITNEFRTSHDLTEAVKKGYLKTDSDFLKENSRGGACCVTALIKDGNVVVSNAGDCRAVVSRGGVGVAVTADHRAGREEERRRIEKEGGYVDLCNGVWRVEGSLAVTRGIGDGHLKKWIIAEPETRVFPIELNHEFLILASDGLWETVGNQEAVDIVKGVEKEKPLVACKKLVELSVSRGSVDDISVLVIQLSNFI